MPKNKSITDITFKGEKFRGDLPHFESPSHALLTVIESDQDHLC